MKEMIKRAEEVAREVHKGQIRVLGKDAGKPYIIHPIRVAEALEEEDLKVIGLLHDVLEDGKRIIGVKDLEELGLGPDLIQAIEALTRREKENYFQYILRVRGNEKARRVKIADLDDNMMGLPEGQRKDKYRMARYILLEE